MLNKYNIFKITKIFMENSNDLNNQSQNENLELPEIFPERKDRHDRCRPCREAYLFFPSGFDLILYDEGNPKNTRRKIFGIKGDKHLLPFEKERLANLKQEMINYNSNNKNKKLVLPDDWPDCETLRFLQSTSYDNSKTISLILEHLDWKNIFYPLKVNQNVEKILNSGYIYIHGRDNQFRPIVVINAKRYLDISKLYPFEDFVRSIIYFIEYMIKNLLIKGQVELWNVISDLRNVSLFTLPSDLMKMFKILQSNYRARLNVNFIVGMNMFLNAIWTLIKNLIDSNTQKKIRFIKENSLDEIFEFINKEQVELKYGGLATNVEDYKEGAFFFPPIIPSDNYLKEEDDKFNHLISEKKYRELYFEGKLAEVSPYLIEELQKSEGIRRKNF